MMSMLISCAEYGVLTSASMGSWPTGDLAEIGNTLQSTEHRGRILRIQVDQGSTCTKSSHTPYFHQFKCQYGILPNGHLSSVSTGPRLNANPTRSAFCLLRTGAQSRYAIYPAINFSQSRGPIPERHFDCTGHTCRIKSQE